MSTDYEQLDSTVTTLPHKIKPKWKALAFEQFIGIWDEDKANASTAFDNLQECDRDELEGVVEALGISWREIYRYKNDHDIAFEMSLLAWLMQNCDNHKEV